MPDKNKKEKEEKKLTLEEYESKYTKRQNVKAIKAFLFIFAAAIGVVVFAAFLIIVLKVFEINEIAGYVSIGVATILYIVIYLYPVIKIARTGAFITNVNHSNVKKAKRHNKKLREEIADKIIDFTAKTEGIGWYSDELVGKIAIARHSNDNSALKAALSELYDKDVKKTANKIIREHSLKVGLATALSQSAVLDTLFIATYELNLIKELVFLYGFRPSEARLMRIYANVLKNSLIAYGVQNVMDNVATGVVQKIGGVLSSIPLLGAAVSTVIGSASQAIINGALTVIIGYQTKIYLKKEYKLQDILDNVDFDIESEEKMLSEVKLDISKSASKLKKEIEKDNESNKSA